MSEQFENQKLKREAPAYVKPLAAPQATTDAYALIPESIIDVVGHNEASFVVSEDGSNNIDAKIVGRYANKDGGSKSYSGWSDAAGAGASSAAFSGAQAVLTPDSLGAFDQLAVQVKSSAPATPGSVDGIFGQSRKL